MMTFDEATALVQRHATATAKFPVGMYKHWKGAIYIVIGVAKNTESGEVDVVYYRAHTNTFYVRPAVMFFENVTNPDGQSVPRFAPYTADDLIHDGTARILGALG